MITMETIPIQLKINSSGSVNTGRYFSQYDHGVGKLSFTVFREDSSEVNYSEVSQSYITLRFQDGTYLEPCECTVNADSITYDLCNTDLSNHGTVTGIIKLYSADGQIVTSNIFRFAVIAHIVDGQALLNEEKVSLVNELLTKLVSISDKEDERITNELTRISNESSRASTFSTMQSDFSTIQSTFATIQSNFTTMQSENDTFKTDIQNLMIHDDKINISELVDSASDISVKPIIIIPSGLVYTLTDINIISYGNPVGLTDTETFVLSLDQSVTNVSTKTFNDVTAFPNNNSTNNLTISSATLDDNNPLTISTTLSDGVTIPNFIIQLNYKISQEI